MAKSNLETEGIEILGKERPDLLVLICRDKFLPPTQLIYALKALEWYPDKEGITPALEHLLEHESSSVVTQTGITLGLGSFTPPDNHYA